MPNVTDPPAGVPASVAGLFLEAGITGEALRRCDETDQYWLAVLEASELTALAQAAPW